MRAMRKAALQREVIAVLDMGTAKIGCFILRFEGSGASEGFDGVGSLAGQSEFRVVGAATTQSRGVEFAYYIRTYYIRTYYIRTYLGHIRHAKSYLHLVQFVCSCAEHNIRTYLGHIRDIFGI